MYLLFSSCNFQLLLDGMDAVWAKMPVAVEYWIRGEYDQYDHTGYTGFTGNSGMDTNNVQ